MDKTDNTAASRFETAWICLVLPACVILASVFRIWSYPLLGVVLLLYPVIMCAEDALIFSACALAPVLPLFDTKLHKGANEMLSEASKALCFGIPLAASLFFLASRIGWSNGWALFVGIVAAGDIAVNLALWIWVLCRNKQN